MSGTADVGLCRLKILLHLAADVHRGRLTGGYILLGRALDMLHFSRSSPFTVSPALDHDVRRALPRMHRGIRHSGVGHYQDSVSWRRRVLVGYVLSSWERNCRHSARSYSFPRLSYINF